MAAPMNGQNASDARPAAAARSSDAENAAMSADSSHGYSGRSIYEEIHASDEFRELRRRYRAFAVPATAGFLTWYLLYVVASNWADALMSMPVVGNINVALVFGLLQFASTFAIAWAYARHASRELDPVADRLERRYRENVGP